jgi:hypothetical protein
MVPGAGAIDKVAIAFETAIKAAFGAALPAAFIGALGFAPGARPLRCPVMLGPSAIIGACAAFYALKDWERRRVLQEKSLKQLPLRRGR